MLKQLIEQAPLQTKMGAVFCSIIVPVYDEEKNMPSCTSA